MAAQERGANASAEEYARHFSNYHWSSFVAMETRVEIVPRFSMKRIHGIGGNYGPFVPNYPVEVPLWLALHLRQTDTCTINVPDYLKVPSLRRTLELERASDVTFEPLPFHAFEIAKRLCDQAPDDVPSITEAMRLLEEIKQVRKAKLLASMGVFEADNAPLVIPGIKVWNLVSTELHHLRESFALVLSQTVRMDQRRQPPQFQPPLMSSTSAVPIPGTRRGRVSDSSLFATTDDTSSHARPSDSLSSTAYTTTDAEHTRASVSSTVDGPSSSSELRGGLDADTTMRMSTSSQGTTTTTTTAMVSGVDPSDMASTSNETGATQPVIKKRRTLRQS